MKFLFRLAMLLSFSSVFSFAGAISASNYITDFGIYVYGDIQSIENAFILVQAIATSSAMPYIIALIVAFFLPYAAFSYFKEGNGATFAANLTFLTVSVLSLDVTNLGTTVHIEDLRIATNTAGIPAKTYAQVDKIPYPIALLTSTASTITYEIKKVYGNAVQLINVANGLDIKGASDSDVGFGNALGDILKLSKAASFVTGDQNTTLFGRATQAYVNDCALKQAVAINPNLIQNIRNPKKDLFLAIEPATLGIDTDSYKIDFDSGDGSGSQEYTCKNFYRNFIHDKYGDEADKLQARLNKNTTSNLGNSDVTNAMKAVGADINDSFITSDLGKWQGYAMNVAALEPVRNALRNYSTDITVPNEKTAAASLAALQSDGVGRFAWMAAILPLGFHFMLGIIYTISILIMIVATALGYQKGMMIWKNFAKGLLTFEFIKVALVIVNSSVNQYAATHAADFLASVGQNPATIASLPQSLNYIATMAGVAGILGISAIFMIPAMVFSGEVGMAVGALSGLASSYKGNDVQTAVHETAQQKATQAAWEKDLQDQASLDHLGLSVPEGMGASQYYAEYKKSAESANAGFGAARMGTGAMDSAAHAVKGQTMQSIQAMSTLDSVSSMNDFVAAGAGTGAMMANKLGSDIGYGKTVTAESAKVYGELAGEAKGHADTGTYEGAVNVGVDNYLKGTEDQAAKKSATTGSYGKKTSLKEAIDAGRFEGLMSAGATHAEAQILSKYGEDKVVSTSKTNSLSKEIKGITNAEALTDKFGENLEGEGTFIRKSLTKSAAGKIDKRKEEIETANAIANDKTNAKALRDSAKNDIKDLNSQISDIRSNKSSYKETPESMSYEHMAKNEASSKLAGEMGSAKAFDKIGFDTVAGNVQYGVESQAKKTAEKIAQQGGLERAVNIDTQEAGIKAASQRDVTRSQFEEAGKALKMSTKEIQKAFEDGGSEAARKIKNALGDLSGTMAGSKTRSDMASVAEAGGSEGYKELQASSAMMKTAQSIGSVEAGKRNGFLDSNGNVTGLARESYLNAASQDFARSAEMLKQTDDPAKNEKWVKGLEGKGVNMSDFKDANGHALSGQAMRDAIAKNQAMLFSHGKGIVGHDGKIFSGTVINGHAQGSVSGGLSSKEDNSAIETDGHQHKVLATDAKTRNAEREAKDKGVSVDKVAQEVQNIEADKNVINRGISKAAANIIKSRKIVKNSKNNPNAPKPSWFDNLLNNDDAVDNTITGLEVAATVGLPMAGEKAFNAGTGKRIAKNNFTYTNAKGEPQTKYKGDSFNLKDIPENERKFAKEMSNVDDTRITKMAKGAWEGLRETGAKTRDSIFGSTKNDTLNKTTNSGNGENNPDTNGKTKNEIKQNDSFQSKDNPIISKNSEPIKGFSGLNKTESGIILPDVPKEPLGHMSHMPEGRWGKALESLSHMGKWGKGLSVAAAALTGVSLMGAENQADVGAILDPFFSTSMGDGTLHIPPSQNNGSSPVVRTLEAVQNDPGMASAIDTYNTDVNMSTLQNHQPGRPMSFNTRGGKLQMMNNSKTGMLRMHLPDQPFATDTNMPYGQLGNILNDPTAQQQFSQMLAQTNLTPENSQGITSAGNLHGFKSELNSSIGVASMNARKASMGSNQTASMMETLQEYMEDDMGEIYEDIQDKQDELSNKMDDLM